MSKINVNVVKRSNVGKAKKKQKTNKHEKDLIPDL